MTPPIIIPAETLQADESPAPASRHPLIWALWVVTIALVGAHPLWVHAGMPVPSFLAPILENINV
ncbi:MAG: hypothetical protein JNM03_10705 [Sphingopyxis sp.]|uniref:hypothetical protein n=1 Tax=Sphingopyxis sp. TaxID=1908224 RepID=UPI001A5F84A4|nr:hypothetical protein [Sphingopyxis sp.]MBL9070448.1 hypothetical protein [Sphingopyxis sp.]